MGAEPDRPPTVVPTFSLCQEPHLSLRLKSDATGLTASEKTKWLPYLLDTRELEKKGAGLRASDIYAHLCYAKYLIKGQPLLPDKKPNNDLVKWLKIVIEGKHNPEGNEFRVRKEVFKAFIKEWNKQADFEWNQLDEQQTVVWAAKQFAYLLCPTNPERGGNLIDAARQGENWEAAYEEFPRREPAEEGS